MLEQESRKSLLIVEDDDVLRSFLHKFLSHHGYKTNCVASGEEIPSLLETQNIDLVILDILLPGKDGLYWLKWFQHYYTSIPVIIASVCHNEDERLQGLEYGAKDYVVKPYHNKELLIRIENVLRNSLVRSHQKSYTIGDLVLDIQSKTIIKHGSVIKLTHLEYNILSLLYLNAGVTLSRDEIMQQVRGVQHNPLDRSIDIHINKLRKKMESNPSNPVYIQTIRGKGYCLHLSG